MTESTAARSRRVQREAREAIKVVIPDAIRCTAVDGRMGGRCDQERDHDGLHWWRFTDEPWKQYCWDERW